MSHVDDGALHAYLDGALEEYPIAEARRVREHLDVCAECSERLESARRVRSDAHAILSMAAPIADAPSIEELKSYAERTRKIPPRVPVHGRRLSWAASVILAIGVGWVMRADDTGFVSESVILAPIAITESGNPMVETDGLNERNLGGVYGPSVLADASSQGQEHSVIDPAREEGEVEIPRPGITDAERERSRVVVRAESGNAVELINIETPVDLIPDIEPLLVAHRRIVPSRGIAQWDPLETLVELEVEAKSEGLMDRPRSVSGPTLVSQFSLGRGSVRVVPEDDGRFKDEPLQSVPGFEVTRTENVGGGREFIGTITTQRLEGDYSIQVILLERGVGLDVLPSLGTSLNEVRVKAETGWVILRGPRSGQELETLLMRLFPG